MLAAASSARMPLPECLALCDRRDRATVLGAVLPFAANVALPSPIVVALAVWWLGNTAAHHAVHRRTFVRARAERLWSCALTLGLGVAQRTWRRRHRAHHRGGAPARADAAERTEWALLAGAWLVAAALAPAWLAQVYAPGLGLGLALAWLHGRGEHAGGVTSIHARWWNVLLQNDGYHAEHHVAPGRHWRDLPALRVPGVRRSALPPPLRWLGVAAMRPAALASATGAWLHRTRAAVVLADARAAWLDAAERLVLRWPWLRARVLAAHRRALAAVLADEAEPARIVVVGGGLFPRSALLLRERFPRARLTVLDAAARHLEVAAPWLPPGVHVRHARLAPGEWLDADLVVLPLALRGARAAFVAAPPAARVLVHDWLWHHPGRGARVAWWLAKRVYLVRTTERTAAARPVPA